MNNTISCVIRTFNEAASIRNLILSIRSQKNISTEPEIIVVDSGSTDSTTEILKTLGVTLIEIEKGEFNYSTALNLGIKRSSGNLIVILSAHTKLCQDTWLQKMFSHFEDEKVAGVYCKQIPWPDADLFEVLRIEKYFGEKSRNFSRETSNISMEFSNAASCVRRSVWEKHPFIMPVAEDHEWAQWAIENGYIIVYEAEAPVYHSHKESCRKVAKRQIDLEKAKDIMLSRKRTVFLTIRQAAGWPIKNLRIVYSSELFKGSRVRYSARCLLRSFWYMVDFQKTDKSYQL
jgi:glycosyltransferase involved in cell wall biosynthesis